MRFTLTYRGPLPSRGTRNQKHEIRRQFHPQLRTLWTEHPALDHLGYLVGEPSATDPSDRDAQLSLVGDHTFATLIHPHLSLAAELDILLLRYREAGSVLADHSGDLDNQLKTLLDALRRPSVSDEVPSRWIPSAGERPFHCLLDDDKYVTRVNAEVDRLLAKPDSPQVYAEVVVRVTLRAVRGTWGNIGLMG